MKHIYTFVLLVSILSLSSLDSFGNNPPNDAATCIIPAPTDLSDCTTPIGTAILGNLPSGNWTLYRSRNGGVNTIINGSGTTYTDTGLLTNSCYYYTVTDSNGCNSASLIVCPGNVNGLSGSMTATYIDYNNDGVTNLGDIVRYNVTITNGTICSVDVELSLNGMTNDGTVTNIAPGAVDTSGVIDYVITQEDINNASVFNWIGLFGTSPNGASSYDKVFIQDPLQLTISDGIRLNAFYDGNNNGLQDTGEANVASGYFTYVFNNDGVNRMIYTETGTNLLYETNPANTYNLSYGFIDNCDRQYHASASSYSNVSVAAGSGITTYNFPIVQSPCQDVMMYLYGWAPRPGFTYTNYIWYGNNGNQTMTNGTVTFTKDSALTITSISEPGAVITPTGFTFNFTNLPPNQYRGIQVDMSVPNIPTVNLGDLVTTTASITTPPADINPANNSDIVNNHIINSYDPNAKSEMHGGKILHSAFTSNDYLTYTIQFENTGNANAINIRVNDILDAKLDENSLKMVRSSHHYVLERVNGELNWKFNGINLPPSNGSATVGHGYIVFEIKPKAGYAIGDIIPNTANIYFDSNPPIATDPCLTEFVSTLANQSLAFSNFNYSPNPVNSILTISNDTVMETAEIVSVVGQKIKSVKVDDLHAQIDLSDLSSGIYFVKVSSGNQEKTFKIIKE